MEISEASRELAMDQQCPAMHGAMVRAAQCHEVVEMVSTTVSSRLDVMNVQKYGVPASGHGAAARIASQHATSN